MRVHFFWPDSHLDLTARTWNHTGRALFWVSVTPEEVEAHMRPLMSEESWAVYTSLPPTMVEEHFAIDGRLYFMIPCIPTESDPPTLWIRAYPYSGMWNGGRPWIAIGPPKSEHPFEEPEGVEVAALTELFQLPSTLRYTTHLVPNQDTPPV